jgi:hypothetical protein
MNKNPSDNSALTGNLAGIGPVPREIEHERMPDPTWDAGHPQRQGSPADDDSAKRKLTRTSGAAQQEAILDSISEVKKWNPVPGSAGLQIPESPDEDEDDEGRSESEQLVEGGVEEAERDQILEATRDAKKEGQPEP